MAMTFFKFPQGSAALTLVYGEKEDGRKAFFAADGRGRSSARARGTGLAMRGARSEQVLDGDVLVYVRPMDTDASADQLPVLASGAGSFLETGKEIEWDGKLAPVRKRDAQAPGRERYGHR